MNRFLILTLFMSLISCIEKSEPTNDYCDSECYLFYAPDSLKHLTIQYGNPPNVILDSLSKQLNQENYRVYFGLIVGGSPIYSNYYNEYNWYMCLRPPRVSVLLNQKGYQMVDTEIISIDSTKLWLKNYFLDKNSSEEFFFQWTDLTPRDSIEKAITTIVDGYLLSANDKSNKWFSKNVCSLTMSQLDSLKNKFPFILTLEYLSRIYPPPPPKY